MSMQSIIGSNRFPMKRNDRKPAFQFQLFNPDGTPMDISGKAVVFNMGNPPSNPKTSGACTPVSPLIGVAEYRWAIGDTDTPGKWLAEVTVDGDDTYPKEGYYVIDIAEDVD